jgi:hypothetical protein
MSVQTTAAALAAFVSLACTLVIAARLRMPGRRAPFVAWTIGFALFTVAEAALWYGAYHGWTDRVFRLYYLTGAILVVPWLAVGELLLVWPGRRFTRLATATMLWLSFAAAAAVLAADVDAGELASAGATPPNGAMGGPWTTILAIVCNSAGTVILLWGSLGSAWRRRDVRPALVAAGVLVIALASSATRFGGDVIFPAGQALGITLILLGVVLRPRPR